MEFRILGPIEVWLDGRQLRLGGVKQRALLAVLLLHRNEVVSVDRLIDELWEGDPPATAVKTAQVHVSQLRKTLGRDQSGDSGEILVTQSPGYLLRVEADELDADRFERLADEGRRTLRSGDSELATRVLLDALSLWRGPALADFAGDRFAQTEAARLEEARASAIEERIDADLALGRHQVLIGELEALIQAHPLRERLRGQLMLALYRSDRQAEALAAYQDARRMLDEELGLEPSESLQRLERAILVHDPALESPESAPTSAPEPTLKPRRRRRRFVLLAGGLAAAAVGAAVAALVVFGGEPATGASVDANSVGVFDAGSANLRKQIAVGASPGGVAASADAIWVANADDQTVSQIDPATNAVVQTIQVGAGPAGIAAGASAAWVLNALDGTVARIDPKTRTVVWTVPVGNRPTAIAYGQDSLWVANAGDNTLAKVDPRTGKVIRTFGIEPGASGLAVGFGSLWLANAQTGDVARIHPETGAVVGTIHVGNGPRALAVGADAVWVANTLDGTVGRIDPRENTVTAVLDTGPGPTGIAVGGRTVWVASEAGRLTRIDGAAKPPRVDKTISLGNPADGAALSGKSVFVAVRARSATHRGGTLRVDSGRRGLSTIDPSLMYETYSLAIPGLTNDGLVAFKHVGGSDGSTLVPDLATSLPQPTDKGKAYTFQLRPGLRYSTGRPVHAEDFRRALERVFRLHSLGRSSYDGIAGAERCEAAPKTCDLSHGIAVDNKARLVTFRLTAPDPDFLSKLAQPYADAIPAGLPNHDVGTQPVAATGPYKIARFVPKRQLVFVRNPFFRPRPGRPDGYPDRIVWRLDVAAAPSTRAVEKGRADVAYDFVPRELLAEVKAEYASQLHVDPIPGTYFYYFDSRLRPFDDVRVRRALNYAVDRNTVIDSASRAEVAAPTCQVLPPNFPGYRPFCPYTAGGPSTRWVAPDLDRAKKLIAASGTKGERVTVWTDDKGEGAYVASVLRRLGYKTRLKTVVPLSKYYEAFLNPKNKIQIGALRWYPDYPAASGFINSVIFDCTRFCDRSIDRRIAKARAAQVTDPAAATALWADIDRRLTWQAPWLFLYNNRQADFVSKRVGNFQYNLQYGILLDQMWVK